MAFGSNLPDYPCISYVSRLFEPFRLDYTSNSMRALDLRYVFPQAGGDFHYTDTGGFTIFARSDPTLPFFLWIFYSFITLRPVFKGSKGFRWKTRRTYAYALPVCPSSGVFLEWYFQIKPLFYKGSYALAHRAIALIHIRLRASFFWIIGRIIRNYIWNLPSFSTYEENRPVRTALHARLAVLSDRPISWQ